MIDERSRREAAATRMVKAVLPSTTNHYDTLFGGTLLAWMDEVAFITATRYGRCPFVTVSIDRTDFKLPIHAGTIVELVGSIEGVGRTSVRVRVDVFRERMDSPDRQRAVTGLFTMVSIGPDRRPRAVDPGSDPV